MGSVGTPEILVVLLVALLLFGPQKLPELGRSLAKAIKEFKRASAELQETIEREVEELKQEGPPGGTVKPLPRGTLPPPPPRPAAPPPEASAGAGELSPGEKGDRE
ncbi:MAG: twin-arginine translocase TatA/TatE family subunit [Acidobacteriota bacterium]